MKIRYPLIKEIIDNLFINLNINKYPIDIFNIFSSYKNIKVISYSKHMNKYNLTATEVITHFGSEEGCTIYKKEIDRYLVFYNDLEEYYKKAERRLWTLAHELGHILLRHHILSDKTKIFRNNLSDFEYNWLEVEANRFASLLLANPLILNQLNISNYQDIMNICNLSKTASINRFKYLNKWKINHTINLNDKIILKQFSNFINKKYCPVCNTSNNNNSINYCYICGNENLKWGDGKMKYSEIELNDKHKAKICPICNNELTNIDGEYCQICGSHIVNKCTNLGCGELLGGDMRYCPICGFTSTFLDDNLLKDWRTEQDDEFSNFQDKEIEYDEAPSYFSKANYDDIPF